MTTPQISPLLVAAAAGNLSTLQQLLATSASPNVIDVDGNTPLLLVAQYQYPPVEPAEEEGNNALLELLIAAGADVDASYPESGLTPLMLAVRSGNIPFVQRLLAAGADVHRVNRFCETAWAIARREQWTEIGTLLEEAGATEPAEVWEDLHLAVLWNNGEAVEHLLVRGADVNHRNPCHMTPLLIAAEYRADARIVQLLIDAGSQIDDVDDNGQTALMLAIWQENAEVVALLLAHGADPNVRDSRGETPLHLAPRGENMELARMLLDAGADINARSSEAGMTPLLWASTAEMVEFLIGRGASVNAQTEDYGQTALHFAYYAGRYDILKTLLLHGADPNLSNKEGVTVLLAATRDSNAEILAILIAAEEVAD